MTKPLFEPSVKSLFLNVKLDHLCAVQQALSLTTSFRKRDANLSLNTSIYLSYGISMILLLTWKMIVMDAGMRKQ